MKALNVQISCLPFTDGIVLLASSGPSCSPTRLEQQERSWPLKLSRRLEENRWMFIFWEFATRELCVCFVLPVFENDGLCLCAVNGADHIFVARPWPLCTTTSSFRIYALSTQICSISKAMIVTHPYKMSNNDYFILSYYQIIHLKIFKIKFVDIWRFNTWQQASFVCQSTSLKIQLLI